MIGNDSTQEKKNKMLEVKKDLKMKKRDLNETVPNSDSVLPFAKTFKKRPQRPHFGPLLLEMPKALRERFALALMQSFLDLSEKVENLGKDLPINRLDVYKEAFVYLEKYGFDARAPLSQIDELLSVKQRQAQVDVLEEEQKGFEKEPQNKTGKKRSKKQNKKE